MAFVGSIQVMNEKAVGLLRQGNFEQAVILLDIALGRLMTSLNRTKDSCSNVCCGTSVGTEATSAESDDGVSWDDSCSDMSCVSSDSETSRNSSCCASQVFDEKRMHRATRRTIRSVPLCSLATSCIQQHHRFADNIFEFYPRALVYHHNLEDACEGQLCVLLFNLGVAYHNEAIRLYAQFGRAADPYFQYALNLYNLSQVHLHQAWSVLENEDMKLLMGLALSNNCGHIHAHQLNFKETRYSLEAIQHFMNSTCDDDEACKEGGGLTGGDFAFFSRTSLIFEDNTLGIAPSA